jgi:hypothetical protein
MPILAAISMRRQCTQWALPPAHRRSRARPRGVAEMCASAAASSAAIASWSFRLCASRSGKPAVSGGVPAGGAPPHTLACLRGPSHTLPSAALEHRGSAQYASPLLHTPRLWQAPLQSRASGKARPGRATVRRGRAGGCGARAHRGCVGGLHDVAAAGLRSERGHAPGQPLQRAAPRLGRRGCAGEERLQRAAAGRVRTNARQRARRQHRQALRKLARRLLSPAALSPAQPPEGELGHGWCTAGLGRLRVSDSNRAACDEAQAEQQIESQMHADRPQSSRPRGLPLNMGRALGMRSRVASMAQPSGDRRVRSLAAPRSAPVSSTSSAAAQPCRVDARRPQPLYSRLRRALPARSAALHCATGAQAAHRLQSRPVVAQPPGLPHSPPLCTATAAPCACSQCCITLTTPAPISAKGRAGLAVQQAY